ncbi:iron ABC transporter [Neptunitalea chrysea]|uniref:Iron ABC transporter n=2 Tax=Neptunitalea chrysea TaxID=1647581 RepID=A0A9W6B366_9FLAO|nr:iron ABC transporter [Neptunitalea chrysea]
MIIDISLGSVKIPFTEVFQIVTGQGSSKETWTHIVLQYRLPKTITAILTGFGLSVSGLLMQTLFRNPLAGPFVLGISSGASLGVAILVMGGSIMGFSFLSSSLSIAIGASIGSFIVLLAILIVARNIRDTMALLIIGLMFGSLTSAIVNILSYFASMEKLQQYVFWNLGSLGNLSWPEVGLFAAVIFIGIFFTLFTIKGLNALLLGEQYAISMGVSVKKIRLIVMISASLLAGSITAFAGPITFIGLAVPHITRLLFKSANHLILIPATMLTGSIVMLFCDSIAQLPGSQFTLPINAITAIIGSPMVIWLLLRKRKILL